MKRPSAKRRTPVSRQAKPSASPSYDGLLDGLPMGVILLNASHVIQTMNAEAARLGMTQTHFVNPTGLPDQAHHVGRGHGGALDEVVYGGLEHAIPDFYETLESQFT